MHLIRPEISGQGHVLPLVSASLLQTMTEPEVTLRREFAQFLGPNIHASVILIDFS